MKFVRFKKIISAVLVFSVSFSAITAMADNQYGIEKQNIPTKTDIIGGFKGIARKSVPYVAVGVPSAAVVTTSAVLLFKYLKKGSPTDTFVNDMPPAQEAIPQNIVVDQPQLKDDEINEYVSSGELPGMEFYFINNRFRKNYYFYVITDSAEARKYFRARNLPDQAVELISKWQNHVIYQNSAGADNRFTVNGIFGAGSTFAQDFANIIKNIKNKSGEGKQKHEYSPQSNCEISGGKPVIKDDEFDNPKGIRLDAKMSSPINREMARHRSDDLSVVNSVDSGINGAPNEESPSHVSEENSDELRHMVLSSDAAVGDAAINDYRAKWNEDFQKRLERGILKGFKFYRYSPSLVHGTRHCYVITDYEDAKISLGISDDGDPNWKKIVLYQNRWLSKRKGLGVDGWSFEQLFGLTEGFGECFNKMTAKVKQIDREGTEILGDLPVGSSYKWGTCLFTKDSSALYDGYSDEALKIITHSDLSWDLFKVQIERFNGSLVN